MSTQAQDENVDFQVNENQDGSVSVADPTGKIFPSEESGLKTGGQIADQRDDDHDDDHDDRDDDNDADHDQPDADPEREAIRQARREERRLKKELRKKKSEQDTHLINTLRRQNEQMAERLSILEKRTAGSDMARLDKAIEDATLRLQYAKLKIKEATELADGAALAEANEAWYESRRQIESLEALKKKAVEADSTAKHSVPRAPDPLLKRHATAWMDRNRWYDPNGRDMDSQVATKVDEALVAEGWDPTSAEYWEELDNRLTKYLPHRYNGGNDDKRSSERRPRSVVTGSGRESNTSAKPGEFRLSPERVRAIKEAGKWDNLAERNRMIKKYAEYDRAQRGNE